MSSFTSRLEVTPLDDGRKWRLIRTFRYHVGSLGSGVVITIPAGFVTDFASSPRIFWPVLSPWGKWGKAAVVHDLLYQRQGYGEWRTKIQWLSAKGKEVDGETLGAMPHLYPFFDWTPTTRKWADHIFLEAMGVLGVAPWRRRLMYWGVRLFGWLAWNQGGK